MSDPLYGPRVPASQSKFRDTFKSASYYSGQLNSRDEVEKKLKFLELAHSKLLSHWTNYRFICSQLGSIEEISNSQYTYKQLNSPLGGIRWWTEKARETFDELTKGDIDIRQKIKDKTGVSEQFLMSFEAFLNPPLYDINN